MLFWQASICLLLRFCIARLTSLICSTLQQSQLKLCEMNRIHCLLYLNNVCVTKALKDANLMDKPPQFPRALPADEFDCHRC